MNAPTREPSAATAFDHPEFDDHEQVLFCRDSASGLSAIIALHDTRLGPAAGGCRMWNYASSGEALTDVLRLSRGMTYKNALIGLDYGGGKSVIIGDPRRGKTEAKLEAFGRFIERLGGNYITAEDVGIGSDDMEVIARTTGYALGTASRGLGDPSPFTAYGVFLGIKAAAKHVFGTEDLQGRRVSVQGLGHVGFALARHLGDAGARLIVSDIHAPAIERAVAELGATRVDPDEAHAADADIFAPCALGGGLNATTIPEIRARIVAGAANNQLATDSDGDALVNRGILYAPDYAINAGGVAAVLMPCDGADRDAVLRRIESIGDTLATIFARAQATGQSTAAVADGLAEERLDRTRRAA